MTCDHHTFSEGAGANPPTEVNRANRGDLLFAVEVRVSPGEERERTEPTCGHVELAPVIASGERGVVISR